MSSLGFGAEDQGFIGGVDSLPDDYYAPIPQTPLSFIGGGSGSLPQDEYSGIGGSLKSFVSGNAIKSNAGDGVYNNTQPVFRLPTFAFGANGQMQQTQSSNVLMYGLLAVGVLVLLLAVSKKR